MRTESYVSANARETIHIGRKIGYKVKPGHVITLTGTLGVGKTTLVKGVGQALSVRDEITSPSYTIVSVYTGKYTLQHIDLYRIESEEEIVNLGIEELISGNAVSIIEWGEKAHAIIPPSAVKIEISFKENTERLIKVENLIM